MRGHIQVIGRSSLVSIPTLPAQRKRSVDSEGIAGF